MKLKSTKATNFNKECYYYMACVVVDLTLALNGYSAGHFSPVISTILVAWPRLEILPHARLINEKREFINDWKSYKITSTITPNIARYEVQTLINGI